MRLVETYKLNTFEDSFLEQEILQSITLQHARIVRRQFSFQSLR